jgi:hypothetical protein
MTTAKLTEQQNLDVGDLAAHFQAHGEVLGYTREGIGTAALRRPWAKKAK